MDPVLAVTLLGLLFAGSHVLLTTAPVRDPLAARLGERSFQLLYSAVAAATFAALVLGYADRRDAGPAGPALGAVPGLGALLVAAAVVGVMLMVAGLWFYAGGPYAPGAGRVRGPRGLERITRHPFMAGMALFAGAHALLATRLVGTVFLLTLAALAALGTLHQDAKLRRLRGAPFAAYLAATSSLPFAAILAGRQRLVVRELPLAGLATGLAVAWALRQVHASLFAARGAWVLLVVFGGVLVIFAVTERRAAARPAPAR